jgi:hypothetical protein
MYRLGGLLGLISLGSHIVLALPARADPHPEDITEQQMKNASSERDLVNVANWYGTSLYGWE